MFSRLFIYNRRLPYIKEIICLCQDNIARVVVESALWGSLFTLFFILKQFYQYIPEDYIHKKIISSKNYNFTTNYFYY